MQKQMITTLIALVAVLALGCRTRTVGPEPTVRPRSALVLVFNRGTLTATHRLTDEKQVAALEEFFPGYRKRPASDTAAGWKFAYLVYFDFPEGYSIRLMLPADAKVWSVGRGDVEVKGDLQKFIGGL